MRVFYLLVFEVIFFRDILDVFNGEFEVVRELVYEGYCEINTEDK